MGTATRSKRKADDGGDDDQAKRAKGADGKPATTQSVLEKAKKALEMQKELKEKLARLKQGKEVAAAAGPKLATKLPPPLILDDQGRDVARAAGDAGGAPKLNPLLAPPDPSELDADAAHFDPAIRGGASRARRARAALHFVDPGEFQRAAEEQRLRAKYGDRYEAEMAERQRREAEEAAEAAAATGADADGGDPNRVPIPEGAKPWEVARARAEEARRSTMVPDVEWWDARLLKDRGAGGYPPPAAGAMDVDGGQVIDVSDANTTPLRLDRITMYVEHPVLLDPAGEAPLPPPQPLKLTKRELKKLRTQRRTAREAEKQELIRLGLLEPPAPKVKISNLMRVLGAEATADPTAIEAEVRRQMAERAAAHEDRNLARMLTPAERRQKKMDKLHGANNGGDEGEGVTHQVAVYRVGDLSHPQLRFKVEMNAKEWALTGRAVVWEGHFAAVVVEGGTKTLRKYEKLMLNRINWNVGRDEEEEEEGDGEGSKRPPNYARLVWNGVVKNKSFQGARFRTESVRAEATARRIFEEASVGHYWDLVAASTE